MKTKRRFTKQLLSIVLCLTMLFGSVPTAVFAAEGTDPACYCAEKCGEGSVNEWCDVCRFDFTACAASEEEKAAVYAAYMTTEKVADLTYTVSLTISKYHTVLYMRELSVMSSSRKNGEITLQVKISAIFEFHDGSSGLADHILGSFTFKDDNCTVPVNAALDFSTECITGVLTVTRDASSHTGHDCVKKKCSSCGRDYEAPCDYSALESRRLPDGSGEHRYVCSKNASHSPKDWEKCYHPAQSCTVEFSCQTCAQKFISPDSHSWESITIEDPRTGKTVLAYYNTNSTVDCTFDRAVYHRRWCYKCGHNELSEHEFDQQATCVDMAVCDLCYRSRMGDHSWFLAPHPEKPMEEHGEQCRHCNAYVSLDSDKAAHTWENGICTACEFVCGHEWKNGACAFCGTTCNHNFDRETYKCTVCGLDCAHSFDGGICTECGYYCKHDWDHNKYQYYSVCNYCDLLCGHSYHESYRMEATCSAQGVIVYKCAFCTSVKNEVLEALEHDYVWSYTDITHEGYCKVGKETKTGFHKYSREYFDATCTEDGYYTDTCTECGYSKKTVTGAKLNHYGGEATCMELALCERCGEPYGEFGDHVGGEATCTVQARCEVCGEGYGKLKSHEPDSDDFDCTTPVRCYYCDAVMKAGNATHNWDENNFCSNENCRETKGFTFTFTYGDEVLFVRNVHTGTFYTFEGFEERDGLTLVGWEADEDADEDGKPDFYPIGDYTYVKGDLSFNAVYKLVYTVRFITYDIWEGAYTESYNPIAGEAGQTVILWDNASPYYKFLGWATEKGGEVVFQANEEITLTENLTLYGVIRPYRATFELGEGAVWEDENGDPITVLEGNFSGDWIEIRKFPVRPGYIFKGFVDQTEWLWEPWQDEDTGEWIVDFYFDRADLEMTAVWEECTAHSADAHGAFTDNGDGTHSFTCSICKKDVSEEHTFDPATGKCPACQSFIAVASVTIDGVTAYCASVYDATVAVSDCTAEDNAVLKLLVDCYESIDIDGGVFTLDLGGKTVYVEREQRWALWMGSGTVRILGGTLSSTRSGIILNGGTLNLVDGTVITSADHSAAETVDVRGGTLNVFGGTITGKVKGIYVQGGTVNIYGGVIHSEGKKTSGGVYVVDGTVNIYGGTIYDDYALRVVGGTAYVYGGTFHGKYDDVNLEETGTVYLNLPEAGEDGASFPDGITVSGATLKELLGEGAAYWQGGKMIAPSDGATEIAGGDVTVKAARASLYGVNLILEQKIGLRLWLNKAEVDAIGEDFTYEITSEGKTLAAGTYAELTAKAEVKKQGETEYYTLVLGSLEPASFHKAILFGGDGLDPVSYSINDILGIVIKNENSAFNEGFVTLAKSLWNYGIEAYNRFSGETSALTKETLSAPTDAQVIASATDGNVSDAKLAGRALALREAVGLRIYLNLQNGVKAEDLTFTLDGTVIGEELLNIRSENGNGYNTSVTLYITAKSMDQALNLTITRGDDFVGSYTDSIASICQQYRDADGASADLCTALLRYIQAVPGMND